MTTKKNVQVTLTTEQAERISELLKESGDKTDKNTAEYLDYKVRYESKSN